jgi:hypothetical protein
MGSWRALAIRILVTALLVGSGHAYARLSEPWPMPAALVDTPASAPRIHVTLPQRDAVSNAVVKRFDPRAWEDTVRQLADNSGTRSRYAWRVRDARMLTGHPAPDGAADIAADWIADELRSYGYAPTEDVFTVEAFAGDTRAALFPMRNIIAEREAVGDDASIVLVTAHYDTKASQTRGWEAAWRNMRAPGAIDNATGVATVLELARLLVDVPLRRTVRFVLFSGEELGLVGSRHYAHAMREADEDIAAVVNIDMIGYDSDGLYDLHVVADRQSEWLLDAFERLRQLVDSDIALQLRVDSDATFSDHASFWWEGYSALYVSEESALRPMERHPSYHTANDVPDNVNFDYGAEAARLVSGVVTLLAEPAVVAVARSDALLQREDVRTLRASAYPNPYSARTGEPLRLQYSLEDAVDVRAEVYTTGGRRIHQLRPIAAPAKAALAVWDGSTDAGRPVSPGVYFLRVEARDRKGIRYGRTLRVVVTP